MLRLLLFFSLLIAAVAQAQVEQGFSFAACSKRAEPGAEVVCRHQAASEKTDSTEIKNINIQQQVDATVSGGTLTIAPGQYNRGLIIRRPITLNLKGVMLNRVMWGKAPLVIEQAQAGAIVINDYVQDGQLSGAVRGNLSALRISGRDFDVTLNRAKIRATAMGILTDNRGGVLRINDSKIEYIGGLEGQSSLSHIVYAGLIDRVDIHNSQLLASRRRGHLLKSRARTTTVRHSVLAGLNQQHSRVIDIPCGGKLDVSDSVLQASSKADNADIVSIGVEHLKQCGGTIVPGDVRLNNNLIVFDRSLSSSKSSILFNWASPKKELLLKGNTLVTRGALKIQAPWQKVELGTISTDNRIFKSRTAAGLHQAMDVVP